MRILFFYHSLISDWNHGNAHFLRGITSELLKRGHDVQVFEPRDGWSYRHWLLEIGNQGREEFKKAYPQLDFNFYNDSTDLNPILQDADLVIVHEWNEPKLVKLLGGLKQEHHYQLLFHDTHHRSATSPQEIAQYDLSHYDGVLAFGEVVKDLYASNQWAARAWTWHEAADTSVFKPVKSIESKGDLVWIGNWGGKERTEELKEFLIKPVKKLGLKAKMYGVLYPEKALRLLEDAGIEYGGYLPSHQVPEVFSSYKLTVHVPRRAYAGSLPGIPTIRPFEAMACGIPLVSSPWQDTEKLFRKGTDYLMVQNGHEMQQTMEEVLKDPGKASSLRHHGLETIQAHHTCAHRVDELMGIYKSLASKYESANTEPLSGSSI
ncbi:MAG: glycosyltransferase [Balneolales bacterium]